MSAASSSSPAREATRQAQADHLKSIGNQKMREKKYEEAVDAYSDAIQYTPRNHLLYSNRAQAYIHLKQYDKGIKGRSSTIIV